jgi:nucleolar MIF4G domain-containing protein 1
MLEVLLAIKNNNMTKIPNYDPSHSEHLKKLMKGVLHKGSCVTELTVTLDDLLKGNVYLTFILLKVHKLQ